MVHGYLPVPGIANKREAEIFFKHIPSNFISQFPCADVPFIRHRLQDMDIQEASIAMCSFLSSRFAVRHQSARNAAATGCCNVDKNQFMLMWYEHGNQVIDC